ncbi:MAG TPA: GMC family oxidoreductase N-terminal domain-containing protein [Dongiaceae bacterium]
MTDTPDFVVVGAGSAGCAVAGRLSESGRFRVTLIEAGPSDRNLWIKMPIGYGRTFYDPRLNWMYETEPVPGFGGRKNYVPRGKVLGGSSSINAMVYSRGQASDFDAWEAMGNPGWGWAEVLETYKRMEDHALGAGPWHGAGGPLHVTTIDAEAHPLARVFLKAAGEVGLASSSDLNGRTIEGAGFYQITTRAGWRESAATAYLRPRPNLQIITQAQVKRLLLDGRRVVGVVYDRDGTERQIRAGREVILSAGSIGSPQLLQLSGIGPGALLRRLGIAVARENSAVGHHLQDHLCYDHILRAKVASLNETLRPWHGKVRVALTYLLRRRGPLSMSLNQGGGYYKSTPDRLDPDIQLYFSPLTYTRAPNRTRPLMNPDPFPGFSISVSPCKPRSQGHLELRTPDYRESPLIHPNYLADPFDQRQLVDGARFLRRLAASPSLSRVIDAELKPGVNVQSDAELLNDIRERSYSVFHPVGTCRMGPDPSTSVVDPRLRVHGIAGLRVVDASIFPEITSGNTNAPTIMVGERGAALILEDVSHSATHREGNAKEQALAERAPATDQDSSVAKKLQNELRAQRE